MPNPSQARAVVSVGSGDLTLLEAWSSGDRRAGEVLVRRHFASLDRFFATKVPEADRADLIQSTLLECTRAVERFRGDARFRTYLFSIARNVLLHYYRTRTRKLDPLDPLTGSMVDRAEEEGALTGLARQGEQRALQQALQRLPLELRLVIELKYMEHMTASECAVVLGVCPSTVGSRLSRAKQRLRELLAGRAR